jgi:hypothetical protein
MRGICSIVANEDGGSNEFTQNLYDHLRTKEGHRYSQDADRFSHGMKSILDNVGLEGIDKGELQSVFEKAYELSKGDNGNIFEYVQISIGVNGRDCTSQLEKSLQYNQSFLVHDSGLPRNDWFRQLKSMKATIDSSRPSDSVYILPFVDWDGDSSFVISGELNLPHTGLITIDASSQEISKYKIPKSNLCGLPVMAKYLLSDRINPNWRVLASKDVLDRSKEDLGKLGFNDFIETDTLMQEELSSSFIQKQILYYNTGHIGRPQIDMVKKLREVGVTDVISANPHGLFMKEEIGASKNPAEIIARFDRFYVGDVSKQQSLDGLKTISLAGLVGDEVYRIFAERNSLIP